MIDKTAQHKKSAHPSTNAKPSANPSRPPVFGAPKPTAPVKPLTPEQRAKVEQICGGLDMLQEDTSVPRNIRRGAEDAKKLLLNDTMALDVRKSGAIGILDELANDPNIPLHGRTLIWSIMSQLEPLA
jgi:uncharacterized protein (UPF0147 family)